MVATWYKLSSPDLVQFGPDFGPRGIRNAESCNEISTNVFRSNSTTTPSRAQPLVEPKVEVR